MKDIRLALMTGVDIPIPDLQLILHQPNLIEISMIGEQDFFSAIHYLSLQKESLIEDKALLQQLSNFQVLMKVISQPNFLDKKNAILDTLSLLFPNYAIMFTPQSIIMTKEETTVMIDNNNFDILQNILKEAFCVNSIFQGDNITYNPANAKAKEIADKLMRGRQRAAQLKEANNESILTRYMSILTIGSILTLQQCKELTIFQLFDLIERYNLFTEWDINLKIRLAGGDPKSEAENWMKNIH